MRKIPLTPGYRLLLALSLTLTAAVAAYRAPAAQAAVRLQTLAVVTGQPDDIAVDRHSRLIWGDLASGTLDRLAGGRVSIIARGLSVPEGVVVLPNGKIVVAEQGKDRIVRIDRHGNLKVLYTLSPLPGVEGVDSFGRDPRNGDLIVPDSPRGTVLRMTAGGGTARIIARGLGRPVDAAVDDHGNVLVPDEHLGTLIAVTPRGRISHRGILSTPDDVRIAANGRIWITTLGDGGLWEINPGSPPRRVLSGLANPQGLTLDGCGDPIIVEQNTGRIVRLLLTPASARCRL